MSFTKSNIAWIDTETNGLDASKNSLLEIAVIVTDCELNVLDEVGFHAVVRYELPRAQELYDQAVPFVQDMHTKTGLWHRLSEVDALPRFVVDRDLRDYLQHFGEPGTMPVAGNTVRLDMNFMDANLPTTAKFLDYHMRDVSTVAGFANDWYDLPWFQKKSDHTAMVDIRESIREIKHYREAVFRNAAEDKALTAAYDAALYMPQGTMTAEQWTVFAALCNAAEQIVTRVESHGTITVSETQ